VVGIARFQRAIRSDKTGAHAGLSARWLTCTPAVSYARMNQQPRASKQFVPIPCTMNSTEGRDAHTKEVMDAQSGWPMLRSAPGTAAAQEAADVDAASQLPLPQQLKLHGQHRFQTGAQGDTPLFATNFKTCKLCDVCLAFHTIMRRERK
jgi:hypothetical protein